MKVISGKISSKYTNEGIACALGFFDGVHIGHRNLLKILKNISSDLNLRSMVFTFEKHPLTIIDKSLAPKLICDNDSKSRIFQEYGIDIVNYNKVDKKFISIEPEDFLKNVLIDKFNVKAVVTGFNFRFGYKGRGDTNLLSDFAKSTGLHTRVVEPVCMDGTVISSTSIRDYISKGDISKSNKFLGRCFSLPGKVVHGMGRGHGLGFPTANVSISSDLIVPKNGVYVTRVIIDDVSMAGVTNVGYNPTFGNDKINIETHIIDYDDDIYGRDICIEFCDRLRGERKFSNLAELSHQIDCDKQDALRYFEQHQCVYDT